MNFSLELSAGLTLLITQQSQVGFDKDLNVVCMQKP